MIRHKAEVAWLIVCGYTAWTLWLLHIAGVV